MVTWLHRDDEVASKLLTKMHRGADTGHRRYEKPNSDHPPKWEIRQARAHLSPVLKYPVVSRAGANRNARCARLRSLSEGVKLKTSSQQPTTGEGLGRRAYIPRRICSSQVPHFLCHIAHLPCRGHSGVLSSPRRRFAIMASCAAAATRSAAQAATSPGERIERAG